MEYIFQPIDFRGYIREFSGARTSQQIAVFTSFHINFLGLYQPQFVQKGSIFTSYIPTFNGQLGVPRTVFLSYLLCSRMGFLGIFSPMPSNIGFFL